MTLITEETKRKFRLSSYKLRYIEKLLCNNKLGKQIYQSLSKDSYITFINGRNCSDIIKQLIASNSVIETVDSRGLKYPVLLIDNTINQSVYPISKQSLDFLSEFCNFINCDERLFIER